MTYACTYEVPGDEGIYRQVNAAIGDADFTGLVTHLTVATDTGLRHYEVWKTKADWERFRDHRVRPAVDKVLTDLGFEQVPPPPVEEELKVVDVIVGS